MSEDCAASIFRIEMCSDWKVDIDLGGVCRGVGVRWVTVQANRRHGRKVLCTGPRGNFKSWTTMKVNFERKKKVVKCSGSCFTQQIAYVSLKTILRNMEHVNKHR
jgi:hypothetical protein